MHRTCRVIVRTEKASLEAEARGRMDAEAECQFRRYRSLTSTISTRFASATFQTCAEFLRSISFLAAAAQLKRRERTRWEPNLFSHQAANSRTLPPLIILFKQNQFILPVPCSCSLPPQAATAALSFFLPFLPSPAAAAGHTPSFISRTLS